MIEILVVIGIMGLMVTVGLVNIRAGKGGAQVKGATRDVFAAIRHARSTALVTGQPAIITYSTVEQDGEVMAKIEITSAKLFDSTTDRSNVQTLTGEPIEGEGYELVHIEGKGSSKTNKTSSAKSKTDSTASSSTEGEGETLEDILFAPIDDELVKGMRIKVVMGTEGLEETETTHRSKISVFSNVDYLLGKFKSAKAAAETKKGTDADASSSGTGTSSSTTGKKDLTKEELQEPVSVVWETNGRVEPHQVWVYADGKRPEDGLSIKIDRFGAAKVVSGDGKDEDD